MLARIVADKEKRIAEQKRTLPIRTIKKILTSIGSTRPFHEAIKMEGVSVIAEVKKASPSKGCFALTMTAPQLAAAYETGGARGISVLTEEDYFLGSTEDLKAVRAAVGLPVLRKDFIIDEYQLYESRAVGADAVLLIVGLLPENVLSEYLSICKELGLAALVEAHSQEEIETALSAGAGIIGINNRDLKSFKTDVAHTLKLAEYVPGNVALVSESGISSAEDVARLFDAGVDAVLVGEALVCSGEPAKKIRKLLGELS